MPFTPPSHVPYTWHDAPATDTPLNSADLTAMENDLAGYTQTCSQALNTYLTPGAWTLLTSMSAHVTDDGPPAQAAVRLERGPDGDRVFFRGSFYLDAVGILGGFGSTIAYVPAGFIPSHFRQMSCGLLPFTPGASHAEILVVQTGTGALQLYGGGVSSTIALDGLSYNL